MGARGGGETPLEQSSAAASSPEKVFWGLQGSFWFGVWPWRTSVERVTHLWGYRGSGRSGVGRARAAAALRTAALRRTAFWTRERPTCRKS